MSDVGFSWRRGFCCDRAVLLREHVMGLLIDFLESLEISWEEMSARCGFFIEKEVLL